LSDSRGCCLQSLNGVVRGDAERAESTPPQLDQAWHELLQAEEHPVRDPVRADVPAVPGVYLWRHDDALSYVGTASNLRGRAWSTHLEGGRSLAGSSLRRNVCELLFEIPPSVTAKPNRQLVTAAQAADIREWLREGTVASVERPTRYQARAYEAELRRSYLPPLKRV
jgi:hypothetical protein